MPDEQQQPGARPGYAANATTKPGDILAGRYQLRGVLGRGGMAEVRDGWDLRLSRAVAIKLLHPGFTVQPENRLRFEAEARSAATVSSPHIVVVHDSGEHAGTPFIVMERLPGFSLADQIARGPLPQPMVRAVLDDVLNALAVAHQAGILHRDIKPGNILFTATGATKVTDFGIAKTADAAYTRTGEILGTIAYLSPQRVLGRPATVSDDLYAAGVVGYEALTGRRPFAQPNPGALAHAILQEQPPPLTALRPDVEPGLAAVIERAMARDPVRRFRNAHEMRAALSAQPPTFTPHPATRVLSQPLPPASTVGPWARPRPPTRKHKVLAVAALLATAVLAIILAAVESESSALPTPATTSTAVPTTPNTTGTLPSNLTDNPQPPPGLGGPPPGPGGPPPPPGPGGPPPGPGGPPPGPGPPPHGHPRKPGRP